MRKIFILASAILITISAVVLNMGSAEQTAKKKLYQRIVALAPSMSDTLIALEEGQRLVGVTIHCQLPETMDVSKIGSFAEPSFEKIMALNPDLVLAVPHVMAKATLDRLRENHIEVFAEQPDSLMDIKFIIAHLAERLDVPEKGLALNQKIDRTLLLAKEQLSHLGFNEKTALIAISSEPLVVAGINTFPSEILSSLGFKNMANNDKAAWPVWPVENLITDPPEVLIVASGEGSLYQYKKLFSSIGLDLSDSKMRLIIPKRFIFNSPSPRIIEDVKYLSAILQSGI